jgi:multicomponent Na+:H+ antiporter subunit F
MMDIFVFVIIIFLVMTSFVALYRAYKGPSAADRIVAINVISTKVSSIIVMIALISHQSGYVSVALIYAMVGFIATLGVAKYLLRKRLD